MCFMTDSPSSVSSQVFILALVEWVYTLKCLLLSESIRKGTDHKSTARNCEGRVATTTAYKMKF